MRYQIAVAHEVSSLMEGGMPTADYLASMLGLIEAFQKYSAEKGEPGFSEVEHWRMFTDIAIPRLALEPPESSEVVYSTFCARWLARFADRFCNPPKDADYEFRTSSVFTCAVEVMIEIQRNVYFAKFMLSYREGAAWGNGLVFGLTSALVWELDKLKDPAEEKMFVSEGTPLDECVEILWKRLGRVVELYIVVLSFHFTKEKQKEYDLELPSAKRFELRQLLLWANNLKGNLVGDVFVRAAAILRGDAAAVAGAKKLSDSLEGLQVCALPRCEARRDLLQCAK